MSSPTTAINRYDLSMSYGEFNLRLNRLGFIGLKALPPVGVAKQAANFSKITIESVLGPVEDTVRAPDGTYSRGDFEWTPDSYKTEEHGVEEPMDDRTIKIYGSEIRAEFIHAERAINRVLQAFENAVAAAVFNSTTWTGAALTTAVAIPWTTQATAVPVDNIDAAIDKVKTACGAKPNTLILTDYALRCIKRTTQIEDLLKYSGRDDPKNLGILSGLGELLDLPNILVAAGYKNTAGEGATASLTRFWDPTMAMVCCVNTSGDLEDPVPTIGRTIMWTEENVSIPGVGDGEPGVILEEYREENRRGSVLRARMDRQIKILHAEAGHLMTAVTA
ncbi:MAG: hypothetical protein A2V98_25860 [Planctomycetes bacterium RBG_16_64_12]|nr:MAG: hypothetical protein A2V98_25860 [Planctomycetes bacterium RBG_16_64_12]